jgi:ATP-binding cassette, subfamily B, bacterial MsbA
VDSRLLTAMARLVRLGRPHWRLLGVAFGCMALVGASTGAYAWMMGPALTFLLTGGEGGVGHLKALAPSLAGLDRQAALLAFPLVAIAVGVAKGLGYLGQFYFAGLFGQKVVVDLRRALFEKVLVLSPTQRGALLQGDLLTRFTADVGAVEQAATYTVSSWLRDSLSIVVLMGVAVWWSWRLALVAVLAVPLAVWPASRVTGFLVRRVREGQAALGRLAGQVQEGLGALRTLQAFGAQAEETRRFDERARTLNRALERAAWARGAVPGLMEVLASVAIAATLSVALVWQVVSAEALVSFLAAVLLLYQPAKDLGRVSQYALTASVALERLEAVLGLPDGVEPAPGARDLPPVAREVRCEDLRYAWRTGGGAARPALDGVSLRIPVGQVTAVVGESGSGKSTLTALLLRLERPDGGRILVDGEDVATASLASTRGQFALITQEPLLFSASVRENLLLGRPEAGQGELEAACAQAGALSLVRGLPSGLDTVLGERGVTLSVGQKQRLCLARALLARAPVLVLDEATSSLDPGSQREVEAAVEGALEGRTALVITHRLASARRAANIYVLEAGRVVEEGSHEALLALGGRYAGQWVREQGHPADGARASAAAAR